MGVSVDEGMDTGVVMMDMDIVVASVVDVMHIRSSVAVADTCSACNQDVAA